MAAFSKTSLPPVARVGDSADFVVGVRNDTSIAAAPRTLRLWRVVRTLLPTSELVQHQASLELRRRRVKRAQRRK